MAAAMPSAGGVSKNYTRKCFGTDGIPRNRISKNGAEID
jgi:hypothetical protein